MNRIKLTLIATLFGAASTIAVAADLGSEAARRDRMDQAYQSYQGDRNPNPGPAARAENSMKRGAHKAGHAVRHGAHKAGHSARHGAHKVRHAVGKGMRKTGEAIGRGGEKLEDSSTRKP